MKIHLYHGTNARNKTRILKEGLLPREFTRQGNYAGDYESKSGLVYLTSCYPYHYGRVACEEKGDTRLLILKVEVDSDDLYPDEDFIAHYSSGGKILIHGEFVRKTDPREYKQYWAESLKESGCVCTNAVSPDQIVDHVVVNVNDRAMIHIGANLQSVFF